MSATAMANSDLFTFQADKPERLSARALTILADGKWHTSKAIMARDPEIDDRTMRVIAERSGGEILSGQQGYRLTRYATATEARRAEAWLQSQGRKMLQRAVEIRRARARGCHVAD